MIEGGIKHPLDKDYEQFPNKMQKTDTISEKLNQINSFPASPLIHFSNLSISPPCSPIFWKGDFDDKHFPPMHQKFKQSL